MPNGLGEEAFHERPVLFCLHYLAGSAREWSPVAARLSGARCVALDLPGFGDAAPTPGYTVAEMAAIVAGAVRFHAPRRWMLAGHSMGAKVAAVVAREAENGTHGLSGLEGLVLLAGSPPSPEPMDESQRRTMLGWFCGDAESNRADASRYIAQNSGPSLNSAFTEVAVNDALRANLAAWRAWLEHGSREDWSDRVGVLQTPALILAGADDEKLGPDAQRSRMAPHFAHVRLVTLAGAKHLLPLECPNDIARSIDEHVGTVDQTRKRGPAIDDRYHALIASNRVGGATRRALLARDQPDDPAYQPVALNGPALTTLRAVLDRVVPQASSSRIDLAARIDAQLASGVGDGWRFAELPSDAEAYRAGLATLRDAARRHHDRDFCELNEAQQDELLTRMGDGRLGTSPAPSEPERLTATQMRAWFEDLRAEAVKAYLGHPRTLARMGYSGIANGGDGEPKSGFARFGYGERESWEPHLSSDIEV